MTHTIRAGLVGLLLLAAAPGEPFLDLSYEQAQQRAKDEGKLLLVDATASWCPPCKKMEKDTWPAEPVRAWLSEHAVAIQIDVDEEPELSRSLQIESLPTVIIFKDGAEFDRVVGYKGPDDLLGWLRGVMEGKRAGTEILARSEDLTRGTEARASDEDHTRGAEVRARREQAKDLLRSGQLDLAAKHYVWLWRNAEILLPSYRGVRRSYLLTEIAELCQRHEASREAFDDFLDALSGRVASTSGADRDVWADWLALSNHLEEDRSVLNFYDTRRTADGKLELPGTSEAVSTYALDSIFEVLSEHGRHADAGRLLPNVTDKARRTIAKLKPLGMLTGGVMDDHIRTRLQEELGRFQAAALSVGRDAEAFEIASLLLAEYDDADSRQQLVRAALAARCTRPQHATWLDEAEALGADVAPLRAQLAAAAAEPTAPADGG